MQTPLLQSIAYGILWQQWLDEGRYNGVGELAKAVGKDRSIVSHMLQLALLSRKSSTWLLSAHYSRIFLSKTSRQDFLPTGPYRSGFLGFCKGFRRVIGYTVGWRAFLRYSPLKTQISFSFSVHCTIVKNLMDLCAINTAHFICKALIHRQVCRDLMF